jgi:hypothetical protein
MPAKPPTQRMGELHEEFLAELFGGVKTKASGSQWSEQADGRNHHDLPFAFRWDGKSTHAASIAITLAMIEKLREQAHGERPAFGLRWWANEALTSVKEELVALFADDFGELLASARAYEAAKPKIDAALADLENLGSENERLVKDLAQALETVRAMREEATSTPAAQERAVPGFVPRLPWTTVHFTVDADDPAKKAVHAGVRYLEDGAQIPFEVKSVRVERTMGNRPRLIVNEVVIRNGDLYRQGALVARVWADKPDQEVG